MLQRLSVPVQQQGSPCPRRPPAVFLTAPAASPPSLGFRCYDLPGLPTAGIRGPSSCFQRGPHAPGRAAEGLLPDAAPGLGAASRGFGSASGSSPTALLHGDDFFPLTRRRAGTPSRAAPRVAVVSKPLAAMGSFFSLELQALALSTVAYRPKHRCAHSSCSNWPGAAVPCHTVLYHATRQGLEEPTATLQCPGTGWSRGTGLSRDSNGGCPEKRSGLRCRRFS